MTGLSLLWFFVVLALIPLSLWLLRRGSPAGVFGPGTHAAVRVVSTLPLGPQQRIVTIETGAQDQRVWVVLGISAQGITTLHTMPAQDGVAEPGALATPSFAGWLATWQGRRS